MTKSLGSFKIHQVGSSSVITIPKNALTNKDDELNLFQADNGDLLYQHSHKGNPNPWNVVSYEDLDIYEGNSSYLEQEWFKKHDALEKIVKVDQEHKDKYIDAPKLGSVVLVGKMEYKNIDRNIQLLFSKALYIVMSQNGLNKSGLFFYGFQIHPYQFDTQYFSEPAYEPYVDEKHGINGTIDKMHLDQVTCSECIFISWLSAHRLADLQFDLRNLFDMN